MSCPASLPAQFTSFYHLFVFPLLSTIQLQSTSCNSCDSERSGYHQWQQLPKIILDSQSDEEYMLETLQYCNPPSYESTTSGKCFLPAAGEFEWIVSRNSFNGWVFQNHFDCVAAATAGGINSALGLTRNKNLFVSPRDITFALQYFEKQSVERNYQLLKKEFPEAEFSDLFKIAAQKEIESVITNASTETYQEYIVRQLPEQIGGVLSDAKWSKLFLSLQKYKKLRKPNCETSQHDLHEFFKILPFPLKCYYLYEYTWVDLKRLLKQPNTAVLVSLPHHLAMIFALGENKETGKQRHLLVGRPSGGQSPSGWIPFTLRDVVSGQEDYWADEIVFNNGISHNFKFGLNMFGSNPLQSDARNLFISQRSIMVITSDPEKPFTESATPEVFEWEQFFNNEGLPVCNLCMNCEVGDEQDHWEKMLPVIK